MNAASHLHGPSQPTNCWPKSERKKLPVRRTSVVSGSAGVFFLRDFVAGQERFQGCEAGLDFCDVNLQVGHYSPDLVITRAHGLPSPEIGRASCRERGEMLAVA